MGSAKTSSGTDKNQFQMCFPVAVVVFPFLSEVFQESRRKEQKRRTHGQHARRLFHGSAAAANACSISSNAASFAASAGSYPPSFITKTGVFCHLDSEARKSGKPPALVGSAGCGGPRKLCLEAAEARPPRVLHIKTHMLGLAGARGSSAARPRRLGLRAF